MKIKLTSVMVDNQEKALKFYIEILGFHHVLLDHLSREGDEAPAHQD